MRAESPFDHVGIGAGFANPTAGVSLFGQFNDRWSGIALLRLGAGLRGIDLRVNYAPDGPNSTYSTFGTGYSTRDINGTDAEIGIVRAGVGRAWQRDVWRWHLEITLNLPVYLDGGDEGVSGPAFLEEIGVAGGILLVPIGFGVHYVFGKR